MRTAAFRNCPRYLEAVVTHSLEKKENPAHATLEISQQSPQSQSRDQTRQRRHLWLSAQESKSPAGHKWGSGCSSRLNVCLKTTFLKERNPSPPCSEPPQAWTMRLSEARSLQHRVLQQEGKAESDYHRTPRQEATQILESC